MNPFCDNCMYLYPKEHNQSEKKEPHICKKYDMFVIHRGNHPKLPRLNVCLDDEEMKINNKERSLF